MLAIIVVITAFLLLVACVIVVALSYVDPHNACDRSYFIKAKKVCGMNTIAWVVVPLLVPPNAWSFLFVLIIVVSSYLFTLHFSELSK